MTSLPNNLPATTTNNPLAPGFIDSPISFEDWLRRVFVPSRGAVGIQPPPAGTWQARRFQAVHGSIEARQRGQLPEFLRRNQGAILDTAPKNANFALFGYTAPLLRVSWPGPGDALLGSVSGSFDSDLRRLAEGEQPRGSLYVQPERGEGFPLNQRRRRPRNVTPQAANPFGQGSQGASFSPQYFGAEESSDGFSSFLPLVLLALGAFLFAFLLLR